MTTRRPATPQRMNPPKARSVRSRRDEPVVTHIIHYLYPTEEGEEERESRHTSLAEANEHFDYLLAEGAYDIDLYNAGLVPYGTSERVDTVGRSIRRTISNVEVDEHYNEIHRSRRNPDDTPLRPVGFDPQNHECDRCHRIVFDGLVIMSNGMRVGRDCAATMMGRKKSDKEYKAQVEELEVAALQQRYEDNAGGAVSVLSENVLGIEERGRRAAPTTPYWFDGYFTWLVEEWADGTKLAYMVNPFRLAVRQSALKRVLGEENVVPYLFTLPNDPVALPEWVSVKKFWKKPPPVYALNVHRRLYRVEDLPVLAALVERYRVRPEAPKANPRRSRR